MSNNLTGKIYWVEDDFAYSNTVIELKPINRQYFTHSTAEIELAALDQNMIKLIIPNLDGSSYRVNLDRQTTGLFYKGQFRVEHGDEIGDVSCEVFQSDKKDRYILYGRWEQNDIIYTWWAILDQKAPEQSITT